MKLAFSALGKAFFGFVLMALLLFLPAGTWNYGGGWLFIALLFIPMLPVGIVLLLKAPALLQKRMDMHERERGQRAVIGISAVAFVVGFTVAGLDFRFSWSHVPTAAVTLAAVVFLCGYALYAETMRENAYLSRTVKVEAGQTVVDTGLYGILRHPMYAATILMFLSAPILLGSWYALIVFLFYPVLMVVRIAQEEKLLVRELDGYAAYRQKVKYRLIPFVW